MFCDAENLDEAEGVIGVISDWLELDSLDEWVRHDAETVRPYVSFYVETVTHTKNQSKRR